MSSPARMGRSQTWWRQAVAQADDKAETGADQAEHAVPFWETYSLVLGRVVRATDWTETAAADWLRQQALARRVRVRFGPAWLRQEPSNRRREALLPAYEAKGHYGPGISDCAWFTPLDNFDHLGPRAMAREDVQFTEWHGDDLSAALRGLQATGR
jgi:hypothetical protein